MFLRGPTSLSVSSLRPLCLRRVHLGDFPRGGCDTVSMAGEGVAAARAVWRGSEESVGRWRPCRERHPGLHQGVSCWKTASMAAETALGITAREKQQPESATG